MKVIKPRAETPRDFIVLDGYELHELLKEAVYKATGRTLRMIKSAEQTESPAVVPGLHFTMTLELEHQEDAA